MPCYGCDASDYDWQRGPMDVAAMRRDGIAFFTHKATEGTSIQHARYGEALNRARSAGMPCLGAYMVPRTPGNGGHGPIPQQVAYFLGYLDQQTPWWRSTPEFFLQVDTEHWGYDDVAPELGAQACTLLRQQAGKWVIHYAPRWAYGDTIPGDDPLWASSYGTNSAVHYADAYPGDDSSGWAPYSRRVPTFLQYGSRLTIGGQPGCDANAYRGTVDQLVALVTGKGDFTVNYQVMGPDGKTIALTDGVSWYAFLGAEPLALMREAGMRMVTVSSPGEWARITSLHPGGPAQPSGQAAAAPTDAQVAAGVLAALQDQVVVKGIGDAIAAHLHVN